MRTRFFSFLILTAAAVLMRAQEDFQDQDATPVNSDPVELSELKVEHVIERPWLYAELPGIQILSLASKRETAAFVEQVRVRQAFFARLVPEVTVSDSYKRFTVILESPAFLKIRDVGKPRPKILSHWRTFEAGLDGDIALFGDKTTRVDLWQTSIDLSAGLFIQHYMAELVDNQPVLPRWYWQAITSHSIHQRRKGDPEVDQPISDSAIYHSYSLSRVTLRACGMLGTGEPAVRLWPLEKFLTTTRPAIEVTALPKATSDEGQLYRDQCVLFLHWGLRGNGKAQRDAFRRFVAMACERPVTEAMFYECFGYGFEEGQERLLEFARAEIKNAMSVDRRGRWPKPGIEPAPEDEKKPLHITSSSTPRFSEKTYDFLKPEVPRGKKANVAVRPARLEEVWRIMGDAYLWSSVPAGFERRAQADRYLNPRARQTSISDVAHWFGKVPSLEDSRFLTRAKELMYRVYEEKGSRDPELLVVMGYLELALGDHKQAMSFFQSAVDAKATRPSAYYVLARLRLEELLDPQKSSGRGLSQEQLEPVRSLLNEALQRMPELEPAYSTLAYVWSLSGFVPSDAELSMLAQSVRRYPHNAEVTCAIAALCKKAGKSEQAAELARIGLAWLPKKAPESLRRELTELAVGGKTTG